MAKKVPLVSFTLVLTLALLFVAGGMYYLHLSERESYFVDRNFRLLALLSKKLTETVEEEYKHQFQYLISTSPENKDASKSKEKFKDGFEELDEKFEEKLTKVSICPKPKDQKPDKFVNIQPRIRAQLSSEDKDLLRLIYKGEREEGKQVCKDTIQVDLSFSKVFPHLSTEKTVFSDVIVFESETGKVHFQENPSLYKIDDFRDVVVRRPGNGGFFSFLSDNSETAEVQNNKSGSSTSPPLKDILQSPTHRRITIGDRSYELFAQPAALPELTLPKQTHYKQTKNVPARLILAGLVKTEKFQSEYRAIPHTWLLFFLFFVLLGLLSFPFIHLGFMDSHERLSHIHVLSILVACMSGTALVTLLFLDVVWLNNVRDSLNNQLEETAKHIKNTFSNELKKHLGLLHKYDHSEDLKEDFICATQQDENCPITYLTYPHVCAEESDRTCGGKSNSRWVARKNRELLSDHPPYLLAFWVDQEKNIRINWTPKSHYFLKASASVAHRDYVKRILDPDPKSSLWYTEEGHPEFYAQSLRSLGTGKHTVVLSMASSHPEGKDKKWVAAIETEFQFLKAVAIPDGTGFAVIEDDGGNVLFHSDDQQSLWENFFEETDNNAQLKAQVFSRTAGAFQGRYWGNGHSFYSTPLPDVPWSLVVFRNKELFRTINFEALLLAIVLFVVYIVISIIVLGIPLGVIRLFNKAGLRKMFISWFWPDSDRPYWYYTAIGFIFLLFLGYILWLWFTYTPGKYAVWFPLLYPLGSLIGLWALTRDCPNRPPEIAPERFPERLHHRYAFAVLSFLLLFSALPMGIFFMTGTDREMALAMKYNLITLGQKLRRTSDFDFSQIQREIRGIDKSSLIAECPENGYRGTCTLLKHSIHLSPLAKTMLYVSDKEPSVNSSGESFLQEIHKKIRGNSLSRLSNPVSIRTLGLIGDQSPGNPFGWTEDSQSSSISLAFPVPLRQSNSYKQENLPTKWVILRSWPPSDIWPPSAKSFFWGAAVLIVFMPMLVGGLIFIVSRIFPILRKSPVDENSYREMGNVLIIGLPESLKYYSPKSSPGRIDCLQSGDLLESWNIKRRISSIQESIVILEHFECQFGVPQYDHAKLELLAALLAKGKRICVLSMINPLKLDREDDSEPSSPDESNQPAPVSLEEWIQVFQSFTVRYYKQDRQDKPNKEDKPEISADSRSALAVEPYYAAIWQARTTDEKITLNHLARDGFVHAENPELHSLFELGLIKYKPNPHFLDDGFEKYVLNAAQRDRLDAIERVKRQSQWQIWKWPLAIVFVVLVTGLLLTQQEFKNVVVLMLSLLPVLVPTLPELFGGLGKGDSGS